MSELRLTGDEANALRAILSTLVLRDRTGERGVLHGLDRFVSTNRTFSKPQREAIESAVRKLGLHSGLPLYES